MYLHMLNITEEEFTEIYIYLLSLLAPLCWKTDAKEGRQFEINIMDTYHVNDCDIE